MSSTFFKEGDLVVLDTQDRFEKPVTIGSRIVRVDPSQGLAWVQAWHEGTEWLRPFDEIRHVEAGDADLPYLNSGMTIGVASSPIEMSTYSNGTPVPEALPRDWEKEARDRGRDRW